MRSLRELSRRLTGYLGLACVLSVVSVGCGGQAPAATIAPTAAAPASTIAPAATAVASPTPTATAVTVPTPTATRPAEALTRAPPAYKFLRKWGSLGSGDGQFGFPLGVVVDAAGNVYVADTSNRRIQVFGPGP